MTIRYCLSFAANSSGTDGEVRYDEKKGSYDNDYIYMTIFI